VTTIFCRFFFFIIIINIPNRWPQILHDCVWSKLQYQLHLHVTWSTFAFIHH